MEPHDKQSRLRAWRTETSVGHSHLLPHLPEVIEQLQGCAEAFRDEAAALATPAHEPAGGQAVSPWGALRLQPPTPGPPWKGPNLCHPSSETVHLGTGTLPSFLLYPQCWHKDRGHLSSPARQSLWQEAPSEDGTEKGPRTLSPGSCAVSQSLCTLPSLGHLPWPHPSFPAWCRGLLCLPTVLWVELGPPKQVCLSPSPPHLRM